MTFKMLLNVRLSSLVKHRHRQASPDVFNGSVYCAGVSHCVYTQQLVPFIVPAGGGGGGGVASVMCSNKFSHIN